MLKMMRCYMPQIINDEPTAYDVDKVLKEINEWTFNANIDVGDGTVMNHNLIVRDTAIAVSYTHLDVYKRQQLHAYSKEHWLSFVLN